MDKKFTILGIFFIVAAILLGIQAAQRQHKLEQFKKDNPEMFAPKPADITGTGTAIAPATASGTGTAEVPAPSNPATAPVTTNTTATPATVNNGVLGWLTPAAPVDKSATPPPRELSNDFITVTLTADGGAIKSVTLKKYPAHYSSTEPLIFNEQAPQAALTFSVPNPALANESTYWSWTGSSAMAVAGTAKVPPAPLLGLCQIDEAQSTATSVTFRGTSADGLEFTRTYTLSSGDEDPYLIHHTTTIVNRSAIAAPLDRLFVNAGMAPPPPPDASSIAQAYLDFAYYDGLKAHFITASEFKASPSHLFGMIAAKPKQKNYVYSANLPPDLQWVSVKDQFFAAVLMPKGVLGSGFYVRGVDVTDAGDVETTLSADLELNLGLLVPGAEKKLEMDYYVGPKDYVRLDKLGNHEDLIMQFGWFGGFSKILLLALIAIHKGIYPLSPLWAWGWTIIVFTIIIKVMTWPLTAVQVRSAKRMQQFQGPLKAIREKYKDNPQKMNTETMELYKRHKINPAAGCLPLLITFPVFIAFNYMLRTASEMRYQPFLWIHDLSMPDTIAHVGGFPINPLPLLMAATMIIQMHMMPSPSADAAQQRIMKFLPLIFLAGFYPMPSGMILYWTCQNLFTILQQYLTNRRKDMLEPAAAVAAESSKTKRR